MQTLTEIKSMLAERGLVPKRSLGQNFLVDHNLIGRLVDRAGVASGELVLEVGPGTGALTCELLDRGCRVVACELDEDLVALLGGTIGRRASDRFTLVPGDALSRKTELSPDIVAALGDEPFALVANLPYACATPLIMTLLTHHPRCRGLYVTIQREVADRLVAGPDRREAYGAISVVAQALCRVERVATLPRECFWPQPGVTSAMVALERRGDPAFGTPASCWPAHAELVRRLFLGRRKQLRKAVAALATDRFVWPAAIDPADRIDRLAPDAVVRLAQALHRAGASV